MEPSTRGPLGITLLIVEDDILPAMALRDALEDAGYHVLDLTGRHQEALLAAQQHHPDLALVNIQLQGHDDGIILAEELKVMGIPTLFISGQVSRARSARTAAVGSMPKPYSSPDMVKVVDYLLAHLKSDETLPLPFGLEVFDGAPDDMLPEVA